MKTMNVVVVVVVTVDSNDLVAWCDGAFAEGW